MLGKTSLAAIAAIAVAALVAAGATWGGRDGHDNNTLVGTWQLTVNRGPGLPPVQGLTTYTRGHSLIGTGNVTVRGPAHGVWEHVRGRLFADTHIFFRFDATGAFIGSQKIRESVRLSDDGESYTAIAISDQFDPSGNLVASGLRATITATRMHVERIPDEP
jgi:hypothetical protein